MTAQDHPPDTTLLAFAAGTLDKAQHTQVAKHVSACARCRAFVRAMEHVGGVVLDDLPPASLAGGSMAEVLSRLDKPAPPAAVALPGRAISSRPRGVRWFDWRWMATHGNFKTALATAALVILALGITYMAAEYSFYRYTDDYADSTATTGRVVIGGSTVGNIERAGDVDWFRVLLTKGTTYRFQLEGSDTAEGTLQYPVLRLLDSTGRVLHTDSGSVDGPGPGWTSVLSYNATSTETYYVSSEAIGTHRGTYKISAIELSQALNTN